MGSKLCQEKQGLLSVTLHDTDGILNQSAMTRRIYEMKSVLIAFDLEAIHNIDASGLFYRLLPRKSYGFKDEKSTVRGAKKMKAKDRITMVLCSNVTGTQDTLPISLIGSAKKPREFRMSRCPLPYSCWAKAWNNSVTCNTWFHQMFLAQLRKRTAKKVSLIRYNASSHRDPLEDPRRQVRVVFLPHNCTSVPYLMHFAVIASVKIRYRSGMLKKIVD